MNIAIIGAGWNGIHTALILAKQGYLVTLYEANPEILGELSGTFGVRLHIGPHYPLSKATRETCQSDFSRFIAEYPDLVVEHEASLYALGKEDVDHNPSRVNGRSFSDVCREFQFDRTIDLKDQSEFSADNLISLHSVHEPSALVGEPLREKLLQRLHEAGITIRYNSKVTSVTRKANKFSIIINEIDYIEGFDYVINTTGFRSLIPAEPLPFNMNVVSQICAVTLVEDLRPSTSGKPFSFTVMDGRYPCVMPYPNGGENLYIIYHSLYTIVATSGSYQESWAYVREHVDDQYLQEHVVIPSLNDLSRFILGAKERFRVIGTKMGIVQKVDTNCEYRGPIVLQSPDGMIHSISAKITNVFSAADDVLFLTAPAKQNDILRTPSGYGYVPNGTLHHAISEVSEERTDPNRTCAINRTHDLTPEFDSPPRSRYGFLNECADSNDTPLANKTKPSRASNRVTTSFFWASPSYDSDTTPQYDSDEDSRLPRNKRSESLEDENGTPLKRTDTFKQNP